ncbi:class II aldolase/adducin family protein [uncultured Cohaesibacter sp.]|uniref:class II aldolase/adducin family protein n=1 Tax=uncultured Cohaesibacter sp. TaxID=1002546 RepID=UPI0029C8A463|nr:class II aldolase/adducin family protein [uncultured Cohaesibacter sp.]
MEELELRREMVAACRRMNDIGLNQGTSGNVSARCGDKILVTPTSLPYDEMQPEDIVAMDADGHFEGQRKPSSEWRFHHDILSNRLDVNAVLHCHSTHAAAMACHQLDINSFHYMVAVAGGTNIRCAPYATFGTQALSDSALKALEGRKACLLGQHGQIALGSTLKQALALAIEVETLAKMYIIARQLGEPPVLSEEEMGRVMGQMNQMHYGVTRSPS